jgi:hypothetical protein
MYSSGQNGPGSSARLTSSRATSIAPKTWRKSPWNVRGVTGRKSRAMSDRAHGPGVSFSTWPSTSTNA